MQPGHHPDFERAIQARCNFIMFDLALRLQLAPKAVDHYAAKTFLIVYRTGWEAFAADRTIPALLASEPLLRDLWLEGWRDAACGLERYTPDGMVGLYGIKDIF